MNTTDLRFVPGPSGGFVSVRAPASARVASGCDAVTLRVRGDGKRYQFRVRTDKGWDGPAYKHSFATPAGQWRNVELLFSDFQASFRGRAVSGAPAIDAAQIQQIGFLIADRQLGAFKLEVAWIKAVSCSPTSNPA